MKNYFRTKKLNLLVTLLGITYGFLMANTFFNDWDNIKRSFMEGAESAAYSPNKDQKKFSKTYHLYLSPKDGAFNYPDSLLNLMDNSTLQSINEEVIARGSLDTNLRYSKWYDFFSVLLALLVLITYFVIPFHFNQLLGRMKKNLIFEKDNVRLIRCLGIELLIIYFVNVLVNFISYKKSLSLFRFSEYEIQMDSMDAIWLLFGIVVLLVAEILSNAIALKEEQELTI